MIYLCRTQARLQKTDMIMSALADGLAARGEEHKIVDTTPPEKPDPFVVWGQAWLTLRIVPRAKEQGRPFWHVDNGYFRPGRGMASGYYRMTYNSMSPILLDDVDHHRPTEVGAELSPWRKNRGRDVLLALPGKDFGRAIGIDVPAWISTIERRLRDVTSRRIIVRPKDSLTPLGQDLARAHCLVTHSSNVAVDAVMAGVPVFVAPTSPAAPVGRTDLDIENPIMPDRRHWFASLMMQQFTIAEMRSGYAWEIMNLVRTQADGRVPCPQP